MRSAKDQIKDLTNALCTLYDNPRIRDAATMLATNHVTEASKRAGRRALMAAHKICIDISDLYYEKRENAESDSESAYMDERMVAALECANAIKKLIDCKGS